MIGSHESAFRATVFVTMAIGVAVSETAGAILPAPEPRNPISLLARKLTDEHARFSGSDKEVLCALLRELHVPVESQMLVFSKTSLEARLINPGNPRALYFSDSVYVGWVPGGLIEAVSFDPHQGAVFFGLDPDDAREGRRTFVREHSCVRCHSPSETAVQSPLLARTVLATADGEVLEKYGSEAMDDTTPFERRWGGWYVTGYLGSVSHRGNAFASESGGRPVFQACAARPRDLGGMIDTARYPEPTSDVVALAVFEQQISVQNCLVRAMAKCRGLSATGNGAGEIVDDVVDHLLYKDEPALPPGVDGTEAFRRVFAAGARRDSRGDSLKDLALRGHLFANRCSYLIYSESFAALPAWLKSRVYERLQTVLRDRNGDGRYAYLDGNEKSRILAVLTETIPETFANGRSRAP